MVEENSDTLINCLRYRGRFDVPPGTGTRLIVSAVGGKKGFVEETNLFCEKQQERRLSSGNELSSF